MFCKNCGKEIDNDSKVCSYCGTILVKNSELMDYLNSDSSNNFKLTNSSENIDVEENYVNENIENDVNYRVDESSNENYKENKEVPFSGVSLAGFILSMFGLITVIAGLICSIVGLVQCSGNKRRGRGFAIAGLIISLVDIVCALIYLVIIL